MTLLVSPTRATLRREQIVFSSARRHPCPMRYKVWRSNKDKSLHLLCGEGTAAFNALPAAIRHLGPWSGGAEDDVNRLRLPYGPSINVATC
jgi:hypothetical protein